jgi:hypothetical protein
MIKTYSDAHQDAVALKILGSSGYYLDIGCSDGIDNNNTLLLEQNEWTGILLDNNKFHTDRAKNNRPNSHIECIDVTTKNIIKNILDKYSAPKLIDYISLDVDDASLDCLINLPLDEYRFKFMTFEHDIYAGRPDCIARKKYAPMILEKYGYLLVSENVLYIEGKPYEDWFIDPNYFNMNIFSDIIGKSNMKNLDILSLIKND